MRKKNDQPAPEERDLSPEEFQAACQEVAGEISTAFKKIVKEELETQKPKNKE